MWTAIQLAVCVVFLLTVAFWVGRLFGKRRYLKLHEEMKALELSFRQVIDDMELASSHNMKVFEKQSEDLGELLTIADKKILRVNDFLKEMDEACADLRRKSSAGFTPIEPILNSSADRKFRNEIDEVLDEMSKRIKNMSRRIEAVEEEPAAQPVAAQIDYEKIQDMIDQEISRQISDQLSILVQGVTPKNDRVVPIRPPAKEIISQASEQKRSLDPIAASNIGISKVSDLKPANFDDGIRLPVRKTDLGPELPLPEPPPGSPVYEVLRMVENGVTLPQVARTLSMGRGEIELILKIYGSRINMRSVV